MMLDRSRPPRQSWIRFHAPRNHHCTMLRGLRQWACLSAPVLATCATARCSAEATGDAPSLPAVVPAALARHAFDYNWDGQQAAFEAAKAQGKVVNKYASNFVILMRHGQYDTSQSDDTQRKLTPRGQRQVAASARYLEQRLFAHPFTAPVCSSSEKQQQQPANRGVQSGDDGPGLPAGVDSLVLVTSPLTRAMETASILLGSDLGKLLSNVCSIRVLNGLREDRPCDHAIRIAARARKEGAGGDADHTLASNTNPRHAEIESTFFRLTRRPDVAQPGHRVTLVSGHANIIRYYVTRAMQVDPSSWISMQLPHASITVLRIMKDGRVFVYGVGDSYGCAMERGELTFK